MQIANTTASAATFHDLTLAIEQDLANSQTCSSRLSAISGAKLNTLITNNTAKVPIVIRTSDNVALASLDGVGGEVVPEYEITEVVLTGFRPLGRRASDLVFPTVPTLQGHPASGWGNWLDRYMGQIEISGKRRSNFLGSPSLAVSIPIVIQVTPAVAPSVPSLSGCTTRSLYFTELGPIGTPNRKSGLECFDRGGTPVYRDSDAYWSCLLPQISLINCNSMNNTVQGPGHPEGWICFEDGGSYAYAY